MSAILRRAGIHGLTLLVVFGIWTDPVSAQNPAANAADLHQAVLEVHEKQHNVGLAAVVRVGGELVFADYLGSADLEHDVAVGSHTRFGIASITKLFTAITLLQLNAEGKIDLDESIHRYVPSYPEKREGTITVRMLATHRSGIPHPRNRTPELYSTRYETATDAVRFFADEPLEFTPGSEASYSSSNYNLLAAAIEEVTGVAFQDVVESQILEPLELEYTSFDDVLRVLPARARRYSFYHPWTYQESETLFVVPTWDYSFNWGGGNMVSTAEDLARFGESLMRPGLLPSEQYELLISEDWFGSTDDEGRLLVSATGANPGLQAAIAVCPEHRISAAVLSNTWGIGSRSGEMVDLASNLAVIGLGK
jgi:CubicO group peptidase (beta-lactamase class C family)